MKWFSRTAKRSPPTHGLPPSPAFAVESGLFVAPARESARALFAPLHYEPNYAYPLLVWLHGPGSDERQLMRIMPLVSMRNYVAVAPRGLGMTGHDGRQIFGWSQSPQHIQQAEQRILDCIDEAEEKYHVSPKRLFLAGFDCGGTMAFRVAMNHPTRFAGVLSVGGGFPSGQNPLGQWTRARRLAVFVAVGRDSLEYAPARACDDLRLFHAAGLSVTLRQYPVGHELAPQILRDVDRWIIEQITAPADPAVPSDRPSSCPSD